MIRKMEFDRLALWLTLIGTTGLILYRGWWTFRGGYLTGDEAMYMWAVMNSIGLGRFAPTTWRHMAFHAINIPLGMLLNLDNVFKLTVFFTIQAVVWNIIDILAVERVLSLTNLGPRAKGLTYLTLPLLAVYTVLNAMFLNEAAGLACVLFATYFLILAVRERSWKKSGSSGLLLAISYNFREPYLLLVVTYALLLCYFLVKESGLRKVLTLQDRRLLPLLLAFMVGPIVLVRPPSEVIPALSWLKPISLFEAFLAWLSKIDIQLPTLGPGSEPVPQPPGSVGPPSNSSIVAPYEYLYPEGFGISGGFTFAGQLVERVRVATIYTVRGLLYGWSGIFLLLALAGGVLLYKEKRGSSRTILLVASLSSLLTLPFIAYMSSTYSYLATDAGVGINFRFSHTTLVAVLLLPYLYEKLSWRAVKKLALCTLICMMLFLPSIVVGVQSNLSTGAVNRVSPTYISPYYRLYSLVRAEEGPVVAVLEPAMRGSLYLKDLPNVTIARITMTEEELDSLLESEVTVYIYLEYWYGVEGVIERYSTHFHELLYHESPLLVDLWNDGEARICKVVK